MTHKKRNIITVLILCSILLILLLGNFIVTHFVSTDFIGGSTRYDLIQQIEEVEGECYQEKCIKTHQADDVEIQIREDMEINIVREKIIPWNDSMPATDRYGIALSNKNWISVHKCIVKIVRYAVIENAKVSDSETSKYITYVGYEDRDLNSMARTVVDFSTKKCDYSDSKEYFENLDIQVDKVVSNLALT